MVDTIDKAKVKQGSLFGLGEWWEKDWQGMPEFIQKDQGPFKSLIINFECREDMDAFAVLVGQRLTFKTQSIWYPEAKIRRYSNKRYIDEENGNES